MLTTTHAFSGFSVDDIDAAKVFYGEILGVTCAPGEMGNLQLILPGGHEILIYPKPNHEPASFTILNFIVKDIDVAVDELNAAGVTTKIYDDPNLHTDDKGIARGKQAGYGPDIAWFRDPAGNVLSVIGA